MWYLWGLKSLLIIDQKSREVARYYGHLYNKSATIGGRGRGGAVSMVTGGVWSSDGIFRQQNHNWLSAKKVEMIRIITRAFWVFRKIYMTHKSIVQSKIQSIFRQQNHNWLTDKKSKWFVLLHEHFEKNYVKFIRCKRV